MGWKEKPQRKLQLISPKLKLHKLWMRKDSSFSSSSALWARALSVNPSPVLCTLSPPGKGRAAGLLVQEECWKGPAAGPMFPSIVGNRAQECRSTQKKQPSGPVWLVDIAACGMGKRRPGVRAGKANCTSELSATKRTQALRKLVCFLWWYMSTPWHRAVIQACMQHCI